MRQKKKKDEERGRERIKETRHGKYKEQEQTFEESREKRAIRSK